MHGKSFPLLTGILLFLWGMPFLMADIVVRFPTENTALLDNRPQDFYMYVDRNFEGKKSQPWEAGAYGFTRTLVRTQAGPVAVKFHEGIDIKPLRRDASGTPLDDVHPVAGGTVVHASANPTHSNYGRYVVIEHQLKDGPLYSLYAHLASVSCRKGDRVGTGNVIGKLGYSGVGLNKTRAHVHLELCLKLQDDFENWYSSLKLGTPNRHGSYNGLNLAGFDPAPVLLQCKDGAEFSLSRHISSLPCQTLPLPVEAGALRPQILGNQFHGRRGSRFRDSFQPTVHRTRRHPGRSASFLPTVQDLQSRFRLQQGP